MNQDGVIEALSPVIRVLDNLKTQYYIGGSVASSVYGAFRATRDVDIVSNLKEDDVGRFVEALQGEYYIDQEMIIDAIRRRASFNIIHLKTMFKIDIFILKERPFDQTALARKRAETISEGSSLRLFLSSPEDIILHKLEWYKQGGFTSERQMEDIKNVLLVQAPHLDMAYIRKWASTLGVSEILENLLEDIPEMKS